MKNPYITGKDKQLANHLLELIAEDGLTRSQNQLRNCLDGISRGENVVFRPHHSWDGPVAFSGKNPCIKLIGHPQVRRLLEAELLLQLDACMQFPLQYGNCATGVSYEPDGNTRIHGKNDAGVGRSLLITPAGEHLDGYSMEPVARGGFVAKQLSRHYQAILEHFDIRDPVADKVELPKQIDVRIEMIVRDSKTPLRELMGLYDTVKSGQDGAGREFSELFHRKSTVSRRYDNNDYGATETGSSVLLQIRGAIVQQMERGGLNEEAINRADLRRILKEGDSGYSMFGKRKNRGLEYLMFHEAAEVAAAGQGDIQLSDYSCYALNL